MIHLLLESNKLELLNELYSLTLNVKRHTLWEEICGKLPVWAIAQFFVESGQRSSFISTWLFCTAVGALS